MASKDSTTTNSQESLPFGTIEEGSAGRTRKRRSSTRAGKAAAAEDAGTKSAGSEKGGSEKGGSKKSGSGKSRSGKGERAGVTEPTSESPPPEKREARAASDEPAARDESAPKARRSRKRTRTRKPAAEADETGRRRDSSAGDASPAVEDDSTRASSSQQGSSQQGSPQQGSPQQGSHPQQSQGEGGERRRRRKRRRRSGTSREGGEGASAPRPHDQGGTQARNEGRGAEAQGEARGPRVETGMFVLDKGGIGVLRRADAQYRSSKGDIYVPKNLIQREKLREGSLVTGRVTRGQKHKLQLLDVQDVDGKPPQAWKNTRPFKSLTSIDPDFHYAIGDVTGEVAMRVMDLLCPIGRGQRGLIVAPPRSGKTTIMRQFAAGIEKGYPDVHLMVLLIDERPEEATEWQRSVTTGQVFASTADETAKTHIQLAEAVWMRACRMVEMGEDVVILLDSITRLARAYNNQSGSGRTMSGGLDSRAMERPRKIFGSARNTVEAGSLTILGTTLVDTGSRMDQLVFEEFKGTGNMELVLNRKLADRRVFPAIDVERSGTRKEEKLVGMRRLKLIHTLRRVLSRMNFAEAMELLITRLEDVDKTDDFLSRFEVDPEA